MTTRHATALLALLAFASAAPAAGPASGAAPVIDAERAFARAAAAEGIGPAFRDYSAEDALLFQPGPQPARPLLAKSNPPGQLIWWPVYAGMASSGDLGFTTGPYVGGGGRQKGWYLTIWRKQADGSWRWVIDHSPPGTASEAPGPDAPVAILRAARPSDAPDQAFAQVRSTEARYASALAGDPAIAYRKFLAEDARVMRAGAPPAMGRQAWSALLAGSPTVRGAPLGGAASAAGDLAFTYGDAAWEADGKARSGHYVRVWQHRPAGWRVVVDEIVPVRAVQ